ncbi:hypothetical protein IQ229_04700 [Nostoc cf. edaphicum LEGE 07299]|uniref:Transposase n=1 Tax=Nostoc cf. edaphicum LEGE 07299 TaxID=2777974 RepID=A0ABR9TV90_9NOSO|nr:hypothetical protein [Nostoc edaphicum]MBE9104264.1 hypothetical protein [Nostoc cf. edaphicum LEGE 07299]
MAFFVCVLKQIILSLSIVTSLFYPALASIRQYDFPDNSYRSKGELLNQLVLVPGVRHPFVAISKRFVQWSEYAGDKDKSVAPNRWIWEVTIVGCKASQNQTRKYYYQAIDAESRRLITQSSVKEDEQFAGVQTDCCMGHQ